MECSLELLERGLLVALQDLGAAGLTSAAAEMASKGGVGVDIDVDARAAARAGHGAVRDHGLRVPGADALRGRARARRRRCWPSARTGRRAATRDRRGHRQRARARARRRRGGRRDAGRPRSSTTARCTTSTRSRRPRRSTPRPPRVLAQRGPRRGAARAAALAPTSPRAGRCSSSTTASSSRAPCAGPGRADAAVLCSAPSATARTSPAIAVAIDGNGRRVAADPYRGTVEAVLECAANLACAGARAARPDQLPELRQPREAAHRLAADRVGARPRRRLPRARRPGRRRQRLALQRGRRRPDLPDAGGRHGRRAARRARAPAGSASAPRATAIALVGAFAPDLRGSELAQARRRRAAAALPACDVARVRAAQRGGPRRGPRRRARERARHRRGRPRHGAGRVLPRGRSRRRGRVDPATYRSTAAAGPVRRGPGRLRRHRRRAELRGARRAARVLTLGTVGGERARDRGRRGAHRVVCVELREAHGALAALFA